MLSSSFRSWSDNIQLLVFVIFDESVTARVSTLTALLVPLLTFALIPV
jgi:hypothetical protein